MIFFSNTIFFNYEKKKTIKSQVQLKKKKTTHQTRKPRQLELSWQIHNPR